jgi:putative ABC transport system permease protein
MFALTCKNLLAHKMRLVSTAFAVLLGVAFMAGTLVFTDTVGATFDSVLTEANDGVDAMVRAPTRVDLANGDSVERIDASTADIVRRVDGVADVALRIEGYAQIVGPDGEPVGNQDQAPALGLNWVDNQQLNPYRIVSGNPPTAPDEIVIDKASADETGYVPGDVVTVLSGGAPAEFTVSGVASFGSADSPAGASVVLFSDDTAAALLSTPGQVDGVVVTAQDGVDQQELVTALSSAVPSDLEVVTGSQLVAEDKAAFESDFGPFKMFMMVFALVAVFVGAFIINNTFSITVAQRSKEMAMLRALGASRRQILRSVVVEAAITGIIAAAAGLVVGVAVAQGLRSLISGAGIDVPSGSMVISATSMAIAFVVGVVVTVGSAVLPARRASRIRPIAALRDVAVERGSGSGRRAVIGTVVTAAGVAMLLAGLGGAGIAAVGVGALVSFIGVAVLGPVAARPAARLLGIPLRATGVSGEMATRNAMRSPKRTARTASSLMIGVALVAFITVLGASFKTSLAGSLDDTFTGTHVVDSGVFDGRGGFSPLLADDLRATAGVDLVSEERITSALVDGAATAQFQGFDADAIGSLFDLGTVEGDLAALGADGIAVDAERAADKGWTLGSVVPVTLPTGDVDLTVRALYDNGSEWVGVQFVDVDLFDAQLPSFLDARIYAAGDEAAIESAAAAYPTADVLDKDAFFTSVSSEIDQILGIVYALLALAIVIALLGVANTLALSVFERTRELGLLRAVGMTRRQVRATIRGEAVVIALFGVAGGLGLGTFFGWAVVQALADQGIDTLTVPFLQLAVITAIAATAGALAAVLPARRAARVPVLDALVMS